jgi:pimeloyl-ACP methyl ester carboxylesterase
MELFLDRLDDLARECDRLVVIGTSFGSEAALLAGALHPRADAVIAFAPSDVTWAGVRPDGSLTSHWTFDGAPLPFVPLDDTWEPDDQTPAYVGLYEASRQRFSDRASDAAIPVERVREVVLVAGGDDQVWPAVAMARSIEARRLDRGLRTVVVTDPEAGHRTVLPGEPVVTGGTDMRRGGHARADRRLGEAAWTHVREIIQVHHLDRPAASGGRSARAVESGRDPE